MSGERIPNVRSIAVLRANAIGDFIVALPALDALRAAYPAAEIVLLGKHWHQEFWRGRPGPVDRVVVVPPYGGVTAQDAPQQSPEIDAFFAAMRAEQFDLAVQMHGGGGNSNPFVLRLGGRVTIGSKAADAAPLDRWVRYDRWQHEISRYLEIAALAGATPLTLEPHLTITDVDRAEAEAALPDSGRPLVALHPGATNPERWWPADRFAAVADALSEQGMQIVLAGTPDDREQVDGVRAAMRAEAIDLCGRLSLRGLAGLLARCRLMVANDSGPLHLAAAAGTPAAGIYSYFNFMTYGPLTRRLHVPCISWRQEPEGCPAACGECALCRSFVTDVTVDQVLNAALDALTAGA